MNLKLNSNYSIKSVKDLMKTQINMSFKRVKFSPTNIDLKKINCVRSLFVVKYLKENSADTLIINIDESSFNREVKTRYF